MRVVNLAEEALDGVLQAAEHLRGSVIAAESGAIECLRWTGALPLLLGNFNVEKIVALDHVWACKNSEDLQTLLLPLPWGTAHQMEGRNLRIVSHLVVIVTGFLWDYEAKLRKLLQFGVVEQLIVCSSLSERAHECYDFEHGAVASGKSTKMRFDEYAAALQEHHQMYFDVTAPQVPPLSKKKSEEKLEEEDDDDWGWTEDAVRQEVASTDTASSAVAPVAPGVEVIGLSLHYAPLLSTKTLVNEPSVFVLTHPMCAQAFPLLLNRVLEANTDVLSISLSSSTAGATGLPMYSHVKEVQIDHIPGSFRRSMKLLAYTLGEILVSMRLDVKERIFAMGVTSLKIGHTLLRIINELQEDMTIHSIQNHQAATVILVDRTNDLASPCSFGVSLLDRILALLPQTPRTTDFSQALTDSKKKRQSLHITEIFPLHGCEPTPLTVTLRAPTVQEHQHQDNDFLTSSFVSNIQWKGGVSLCHPTIANGANVFRSLAFRPAKLALRDLDKRLQEVEHSLIQQRKITKSGSIRKPGEKKSGTRGRDVVLRRICNILTAGEPIDPEHSSLIELGIIILETLERIEKVQTRWDKCRERVTRHIQLRRQNAAEWILPELSDFAQRQLSALGVSASTPSEAIDSDALMSLQDLLTLLVHAFALSARTPVEDYTMQMIRNTLGECILETSVKDPETVQVLFPDLLEQIFPYVSWKQHQLTAINSTGEHKSNESDEDEDGDWGWNDHSNLPLPHKDPNVASMAEEDKIKRLEAKATVEAYVERLLLPLKECAQLFSTINDEEYASATVETPRSLLGQLCSHILRPESAHIAELEHVVDASEKLTRAGIDLLKSGFSRFGFGVGGGTGGRMGSQQLGQSDIIVLFVVGGITFEEIQEVRDALEENSRYQVFIGSTTITNNEVILEQLFKPVPTM